MRLARLTLAVVVVALAAAAFAIAFRATLGLAADGLAALAGARGDRSIVTAIAAAPAWLRVLAPAAGGLCAGVVVVGMNRRAGGGGVGYVTEAIVLGRVRVTLVRSVLQALASWLAIAGGNSLGREGPLIQAGAAAGEAARRVFGLDGDDARVVLATGVAAGFASAYNAPIAACLFVVEVVTGVLAVDVIVPIALASVIATIAVRVSLGDAPLYGARVFAFDEREVIAFVGLGVAIAPVGVGFLRLLGIVETAWRRVALPAPARLALGGALCGGVLVALPLASGNGFEPLSLLLDGRLALGAVAWLLLAKPVATAITVGAGNPGGVFTPTLLLGALVGVLYATGLGALLGDGALSPPGAYALVGLAAALAATTHAPLTAALLACELTGDYALAVPLLATCAVAAAVARRLYIDSVYTAELSKRGLRWRLTLDGRRVIEAQGQNVDVP